MPRDGRLEHFVLLSGEVAVPGADRGPLRYGPLLRRLTAGADNPPDVFPPSRGTHGFKVHIMTAAGKTGTYRMGI